MSILACEESPEIHAHHSQLWTTITVNVTKSSIQGYIFIPVKTIQLVRVNLEQLFNPHSYHNSFLTMSVTKLKKKNLQANAGQRRLGARWSAMEV